MKFTGFVAAALFALLAPCGLAQQDFSKVEIKTIHVAKNVYMLQGSGGNIGVSVGEDGTLIVDDQFAPLAGKILDALKQLNPSKPRYILNTHHHGDHTGGNPQFGRAGEIIAHANVRKRLLAAKLEKAGLPVVTFEDSLSVHFNGEEVKIAHVPPAHTDGDSVIYFTGANVIHFGDTFFSGRFPNIDVNGGGSVRGYIKGMEKAVQNTPADAKLIPGHGPLSTIKELKESYEMLVETSGIVQKAIDSGKTLQQIKEEGLPEKYKSWAVPTITSDRWLEILYNGLKRPE
jgi:cyclase